MTLEERQRAKDAKATSQSFLKLFNEYSDEVFGHHRTILLDELRAQLQRQEPQVTAIILEIIGDGQISVGNIGVITHRDILVTALMGGNNEDPVNFHYYDAVVTSLLNRALGSIDAGLWPPKEPRPILVISDTVLRQRCWDLLKASGNYDRVIREATTVLEDRIRSKPPPELLSKHIPHSADQYGEKLVSKLFSPNNPLLVFSNDKKIQAGFHQILVGVFSHLRNPHHHQLDETTEWSWAWSVASLIDRLLADIESCTIKDAQQ